VKLWVIRHAKSSWADPGQKDFDRPLNERGLKDGKRVVRWLSALTERPAFICSSDAVRARLTAEFIREGCGPTAQLVFEHRIYDASPATLLEVVHALPERCPSAALVGHNPGSTEFVNRMVGKSVIDNLPTLGIAVLELSVDFADARFGCAYLLQLDSPKTLRN
jgi:phosphohistidine phosphatase